MTDREKALKGLECCIKHDPDDRPRCAECPYDGACLNRLKIDALELLKAQEPVKPVFGRQFMPDIKLYNCGKCGSSVGVEGIAKYCMTCGQAVKWDD